MGGWAWVDGRGVEGRKGTLYERLIHVYGKGSQWIEDGNWDKGGSIDQWSDGNKC